MKTAEHPISRHRVASRDEWLKARIALLAKEKELTRQRDELSQQRRELPWVKIEKDYVFNSPEGKVTLAELFDGRSQLFIKHFMLAPGQVGQCVGCSLEVDHVEGILPHLENHDVTYAVVARRRSKKSRPCAEGWGGDSAGSRPTVRTSTSTSTYPSRPNRSRPAAHSSTSNTQHPGIEDRSGDSVFFKDEAGQIFHTYSTFGRGGEEFLGIYRILDVMPKGRDENGPYQTLADWVRPKNMYDKGGMVEMTGRYHPAGCACGVHQ